MFCYMQKENVYKQEADDGPKDDYGWRYSFIN